MNWGSLWLGQGGWWVWIKKLSLNWLRSVGGNRVDGRKMAAEKPWLRRGARRHYFDARGTLLPVKNACHWRHPCVGGRNGLAEKLLAEKRGGGETGSFLLLSVSFCFFLFLSVHFAECHVQYVEYHVQNISYAMQIAKCILPFHILLNAEYILSDTHDVLSRAICTQFFIIYLTYIIRFYIPFCNRWKNSCDWR